MSRLTLALTTVAIALATLSGCAAGTDPTVRDPEPGTTTRSEPGATPAPGPQPTDSELTAHTFAAGEDIPVTLTLLGSDEGGRKGPYYAGYRPQVIFEDAEAMPCSFGVPEGVTEFAPGETGDLTISCTEEVTIEPDALGFSVQEGGREVGTGDVRLADVQ